MKDQMELSFDRINAAHPQLLRQRRMRRASWWFEQMRVVVDRALDRGIHAQARPEQIYFPLQSEMN